jgi:hypothetical protein
MMFMSTPETTMTQINFTSGQILDIISALEEKENHAYVVKDDKQLAAYYMNLGVQFQRVYDRLQDLPGEKRVAKLVLAAN